MISYHTGEPRCASDHQAGTRAPQAAERYIQTLTRLHTRSRLIEDLVASGSSRRQGKGPLSEGKDYVSRRRRVLFRFTYEILRAGIRQGQARKDTLIEASRAFHPSYDRHIISADLFFSVARPGTHLQPHPIPAALLLRLSSCRYQLPFFPKAI